MDCTAVSERVAAYLDGQLGEAQGDLVDAHLAICVECAGLLAALAEQRFLPLSAEEKGRLCGGDGFWSQMDSVLCAEMEVMGGVSDGRTAWHLRQVGLPMPMVLAYAAAMLLAVAWGLQMSEKADQAEETVQRLGERLEAEEGLAPAPRPTQGAGSGDFQVVRHTPQRATF